MKLKVINEEEALVLLRRDQNAHIQGAEDRLDRVCHGTIPAVKKFAAIIHDESELALFLGTEHCWFFGNAMAFRATIHASNEPSEITCYIPSRDFGQITVMRDVVEGGKLSVRIAGIAGVAPIELEASGWGMSYLEAVLPFLFGHGGSAAKASAPEP